MLFINTSESIVHRQNCVLAESVSERAMSTLVFLSTSNLEDFFVYDELLIPYFEKAGWRVETISWHEQRDWGQYDAVIVRSTWDYQQHASAFLDKLAQIAASGTRLINPLELMQWNIEKTYLKSLSEQGISIVPTCWMDDYDAIRISDLFAKWQTDEVILKPTLSANADDTFRLTRRDIQEQHQTLSECFKQRAHMVQPFVPEIVNTGEYSLFYFAGEYSHGILKTPKTGDFRVQEEHGGELALITPTAAQLDTAQHTLSAMPSDYLYARVDLVEFNNEWVVMELELIEPSLYFNLDPQSPVRFVDAFFRYLQK